MTISAEIIRDSIAHNGSRITTMALVMPRIILPEFNTHRVFSRNSQSSRAVSVIKIIEELDLHPFIPSAFNKNNKTMQGGEAMSVDEQELVEAVWLKARDNAILSAQDMIRLGVAKQYANRILEPFSWTRTLVTSTTWSNFFALRLHKDAQPEIQELALRMYEAMQASKPATLDYGEWHLPYINDEDIAEQRSKYSYDALESKEYLDCWEPLIKRSVARCARVSYLNNFKKVPTEAEDFILYERLVGGEQKHSSPAEHCATPSPEINNRHANFTGWLQYRKFISGENITEFKGIL